MYWAENLLKDEMPPSWMWPFPKELDEWFANVDAERENRMPKTPQEEPVG